MNKPPKAMTVPSSHEEEARVLFEPKVGNTYKVERTSGEIQDDWVLTEIVGDTAYLQRKTLEHGKAPSKPVSLAKLKALNAR